MPHRSLPFWQKITLISVSVSGVVTVKSGVVTWLGLTSVKGEVSNFTPRLGLLRTS